LAVFTRHDAAVRLLSFYPGFSLAEFDQPNFMAFLQSFIGGEIQHVVYDPEQTSKPGATTITGDYLAVIREVVDNFTRQGESHSSS
jgi:hypothetical protein